MSCVIVIVRQVSPNYTTPCINQLMRPRRIIIRENTHEFKYLTGVPIRSFYTIVMVQWHAGPPGLQRLQMQPALSTHSRLRSYVKRPVFQLSQYI